MSKAKVAIVGVGNCASALIQGIHYYSRTDNTDGLINPRIEDFKVSDIEIVAAFDVDNKKVGRDLSEAIFSSNNNVCKIADVPHMGVLVSSAPVYDGIGKNYSKKVECVLANETSTVMKVLKEIGAEIIVNYLPVGSNEATEKWAQIALEAKCAFINCIPEFIASKPEYADKFREAGLPLIGDDVKSQFGATLLHRIITQHLEIKGYTIEKTYQLNFGGNMDFYNMTNSERLTSKKISKQEAVRSLQKKPIDQKYVHIGPSDYVEWLEDNKWCYIHMACRGFGGVPLKIEAKLEVCDSPNSAGVVVDLIRLSKLALNNKIGGPLNDVCSFYMKSPPITRNDDKALECLTTWIENNS